METVGEYLKNTRERKGFSIDKVSEKTKIHPRYINAIEENNFSEFSAETYIKGFLISYAKVLEIEPKEIIDLYLQTIGKKSEDITIEKSDTEQISVSTRNFHFKKIGIILGILILLIISYNLFFAKSNTDSTPVTQPVEQPETEDSLKIQTETKPAEKTLKVIANEEAWIKVQTDTLTPQEVTLQADQTKTWTAQEEFVVSVGNAGGVKIMFNNEVYDSLGTRGEVIKNIKFK